MTVLSHHDEKDRNNDGDDVTKSPLPKISRALNLKLFEVKLVNILIQMHAYSHDWLSIHFIYFFGESQGLTESELNKLTVANNQKVRRQ